MPLIRKPNETVEQLEERLKGTKVQVILPVHRNNNGQRVILKAGEWVEVVSVRNYGFSGVLFSVKNDKGHIFGGVREVLFKQ